MAVVADGAGSARRSALGARETSRLVLRLVRSRLSRHLDVLALDRDVAAGWVLAARERLASLARAHRAEVHDYACTLLVAVVGPRGAAFAQVGDGAIVVEHQGTHVLVFWPESGDYVNETRFVTDHDAGDAVAFGRFKSPIDGLAMMTDGLQSIALDHARRVPFDGFFTPLFRHARSVDAPVLRVSIAELLASDRVRERTVDDRTLAVAVRRHPGEAT